MRLLTMFLLAIAYFFALLDRQILTVLVDPIKRDIGISDAQFGLLQGLAFALFYVVFAVPVGRLADRWSRKSIIAGGLALWSTSTLLAGFARAFGWLFTARAGVGVGEACLAPAAYSMFADLYERKALGRVIGVFHTVGALGIAGAPLIGGILFGHFAAQGDLHVGAWVVPAWGQVLLAVGVPGLILAVLIAVLLREPRRSQRPEPAADGALERPALLATLLADRAAFLRLLCGSSLLAIAGNAMLTWSPTYLIRVFELSPAQAGPRLGLAMGVGAILGPLLGGAASDVLFKRRGNQAPVQVLVFSSIALALSYALLVPADSVGEALTVIAIISTFYSSALSVSASAIALRAPPGQRAQLASLWLCFNTLIGLGVGAAAVGFITDQVFASPLAVGKSLALVAILSAFCGTLLTSTLLISRREPVPQAG